MLFSENCAIREIMCKSVVQPDRTQMTVQHGACASHAGYLRLKHTHSESVILTAFPRQQWLPKRAFILCYTHIACLVYHTEVTARQIFVYF
jgi:hypothetical protein